MPYVLYTIYIPYLANHTYTLLNDHNIFNYNHYLIYKYVHAACVLFYLVIISIK